MNKLSRSQLAIAAVVYVSLLVVWSQQISESPIKTDDIATAVTAVNLVHRGVYSHKPIAPFTPTMYREPVPVLTAAVAVVVVDAALGPADPPEEYLSGARARYLKLQNLLWLTLLCTAAFLVTFRFTSSFLLSIVMVVMSHLVFFHPSARFMDTLLSEIPAAAFLLLGSWFYAMGVSRHRRWMFAAAGIFFGLLALTKALALYVFAGLLAALFCFRTLRRDSSTIRATAAQIGILTLSFLIVVAPWMLRNWIQFDAPAISERGGQVLYIRALYDGVDPVERKGLWYVWAPRPIRPAVGRLLRFSPEDLKLGGRLVRLNLRPDSGFAMEDLAAQRAGRPDLVIAILRKAFAELNRIRTELRAAGFDKRAGIMADKLLRDRAIKMMLDDPLGALGGTLLAIWRGGMLLVPLLAWAMIHAWRKKQDELLAFCIPAVGFVLFHALFSIFEPRYSTPMIPVALLAAAAVAVDNNWLSFFSVRWRARERASSA